MSNASKIRQAILDARDSRTKAVSVPEWGFETGLFVRSMSVFEALEFGKKSTDDTSVPMYLAYTLCDQDGVPIFDPSTDIDDIVKKNQEVVTRLFEAALAINGDGNTKQAETDAKN